jgi:electron transfer flavoprotein alpha subunit
MSVLVFVDHDRGVLAATAGQGFALARELAGDDDIVVVACGSAAETFAASLGTFGARSVRVARHPALDAGAPEAIGDAVAETVRELAPTALVAAGTERANEVLAHVAAVLDLPFAANVLALRLGDPLSLSRVRWGGSLIEHAELVTPLPILSSALHSFSGDPIFDAVAAVESVSVDLGPDALRTSIVERVEVEAGITLQTAPVVVSGGRGVGSIEGFAALERLAALVGGAVGCSRVVTNQGWRPHSDQVGQTGKRVAPELYIACGISGAIQHWIGMQAAKQVLAINTDAGAPMVMKADYAVIGDLHEVVPAIVAELERRRG